MNRSHNINKRSTSTSNFKLKIGKNISGYKCMWVSLKNDIPICLTSDGAKQLLVELCEISTWIKSTAIPYLNK